jgi:hypothetical protein
MIGGRDVIIPTARGTEAMDFAIRAITRLWPDVVLEDAITGEKLGRYRDISFAGRQEILAFRDPTAAQSWDDIGADPSLEGTLMHFLLSKGELTVAIDASPPPVIESFVEALRQSLCQDLFATTARREAA